MRACAHRYASKGGMDWMLSGSEDGQSAHRSHPPSAPPAVCRFIPTALPLSSTSLAHLMLRKMPRRGVLRFSPVLRELWNEAVPPAPHMHACTGAVVNTRITHANSLCVHVSCASLLLCHRESKAVGPGAEEVGAVFPAVRRCGLVYMFQAILFTAFA